MLSLNTVMINFEAADVQTELARLRDLGARVGQAPWRVVRGPDGPDALRF